MRNALQTSNSFENTLQNWTNSQMHTHAHCLGKINPVVRYHQFFQKSSLRIQNPVQRLR